MNYLSRERTVICDTYNSAIHLSHGRTLEAVAAAAASQSAYFYLQALTTQDGDSDLVLAAVDREDGERAQRAGRCMNGVSLIRVVVARVG